MIRGSILASSLFFAAVELPLSENVDVVKYGVTQGGLLAVVLVLLYFYRRDFMDRLDEKNDRLKVMTDLAAESATSLTRLTEALERMNRTIEDMNRTERDDFRRHKQTGA